MRPSSPADLRECLADLLRAREAARRLSLVAPINPEAGTRWLAMRERSRRELERMERVVDGMILELREGMTA